MRGPEAGHDASQREHNSVGRYGQVKEAQYIKA